MQIKARVTTVARKPTTRHRGASGIRCITLINIPKK